LPKNIVVVNKKAFRKLDKKTQEAVFTAAKEAEERGWEMSKKETAEKTAILKENGIIVVTPSEELMAGLKEIGASMLEGWKKDAGSEGAALLEAYQVK
jgi:TRAP-type C4-dicarboxylate transport system substrate-binding protein